MWAYCTFCPQLTNPPCTAGIHTTFQGYPQKVLRWAHFRGDANACKVSVVWCVWIRTVVDSIGASEGEDTSGNVAAKHKSLSVSCSCMTPLQRREENKTNNSELGVPVEFSHESESATKLTATASPCRVCDWLFVATNCTIKPGKTASCSLWVHL